MCIRDSYTPYGGDEAFLAPATPRTQALMHKLQGLMKLEQEFGGVLDVDTQTAVSYTHLRLELIIQFAAFYGLRRSEVLGLRWDAIDFEAGTLTIRHIVTSANIEGKHILIQADRAKTSSSLRTLPLVSGFAQRLKELKEQQEYNERLCGNCYNKKYKGYLFVDEMGNLILPNAVSENFGKLLKAHGLRHIRFHDLRHPYVKHTTKIFSLRSMAFQAQAYPDARRKTRGACQLHRGGQSQSPCLLYTSRCV